MLDFLTFALILFSPTQLGYHFWPREAYIWGIRVDFLSPTLYLTDILVLGILAAYIISKVRKRKSVVSLRAIEKLWVAILITLFFVIFNIYFSPRPLVALYRWAKILEMGLLTYYFIRRFKKRWLVPLALADIYTGLIAWGQFFQKASLGGWFWWLGERSFNLSTPGIARIQLNSHLFLRPYATFSHPNSLAGFLLVSSFLLWPLRRKLKGCGWFLFMAGFIFSAATVLITFSWSAYLTVLLFLVYVFWKRWGVKGIMIGLPLLIIIALQSIEVGLLEQRSITERMFLLQNAVQLIRAHPFFGVGLGNFIPAQLELSFSRGQYNFLQPVHNIYLLIASEAGLIGLGFFLYFLFYLLKKSYPLSIISYPLFIILFLGLFDHYWLTLQQNMLLATLAVGIGMKSLKIKNTLLRE